MTKLQHKALCPLDRPIQTSKWKTLSSKPQTPISEYWNPAIADLYPQPAPGAIPEGDEKDVSQSFLEFVEMGEREPNEEGTGRFQIGAYGREKIAVSFLHESSPDERLVRFISAFIGLHTEIHRTGLELKTPTKRKASFVDKSRCLEFPLRKKCGQLDVFSVFDVVVEYIPSNAYSLVLYLKKPLFDPTIEMNVTGRACGDRVAVISTHEQTRRELFITSVHELLHTMGFDHCEAWACTMNANDSGEGTTIELCPADLRKLHFITGLDLRERWQKLHRICCEEGWVQDADWFAQRTSSE